MEVENALVKLLVKFEQDRLEAENRKRSLEKCRLNETGLRESEADEWLEDEPDFSRRNFTPLPSRRRFDVTQDKTNLCKMLHSTFEKTDLAPY